MFILANQKINEAQLTNNLCLFFDCNLILLYKTCSFVLGMSKFCAVLFCRCHVLVATDFKLRLLEGHRRKPGAEGMENWYEKSEKWDSQDGEN